MSTEQTNIIDLNLERNRGKVVIIMAEEEAVNMVNTLNNLAMLADERIKACQVLGNDISEGHVIIKDEINRKNQLDHMIRIIETCRARKPQQVIY